MFPIVGSIIKQNQFFKYHIGIIITFAFIYMVSAKSVGTDEDKENFSNFSDSLYYTTITHFTVGFGDISPRSKAMRFLTMVQVVLAFSFMNL